MDHTAVEEINIRGQRLLERGDREALRQAINQLQSLLVAGLHRDRGGPVGADPDILAAALKIKMREARNQLNVGKVIASKVSETYRQRFIEEVNELCGNTLTSAEQEDVAAKFNIVLAYWLRVTADSIRQETKNFFDLEAL